MQTVFEQQKKDLLFKGKTLKKNVIVPTMCSCRQIEHKKHFLLYDVKKNT